MNRVGPSSYAIHLLSLPRHANAHAGRCATSVCLASIPAMKRSVVVLERRPASAGRVAPTVYSALGDLPQTVQLVVVDVEQRLAAHDVQLLTD